MAEDRVRRGMALPRFQALTFPLPTTASLGMSLRNDLSYAELVYKEHHSIRTPQKFGERHRMLGIWPSLLPITLLYVPLRVTV